MPKFPTETPRQYRSDSPSYKICPKAIAHRFQPINSECDSCPPSLTVPPFRTVTSCCDTECVSLDLEQHMEECNEQCIVVPCDDPCFESSAEECMGDCSTWACDGDQHCEGLFNCTSPGCQTYQTYLSAEARTRYMEPQFPNFSFDQGQEFVAFLDEYTPQMSSGHNLPHVGQGLLGPPTLLITDPPSLHRFTITSSFRSTSSPAIIANEQTRQPDLSPLNAHPNNHNASPFSCMWANCRRSFTSSMELVLHVNSIHLRSQLPTPPLHQSQPFTHSPRSDHESEDALSCMWANCGINLSPETVPGSSTSSAVDPNFYALASHLLLDHLGIETPPHHVLTPPPSCATPISPGNGEDMKLPSQNNEQMPTPPQSTSASEPRGSESVTDEGYHPCRWDGCSQEAFSNSNDLTNHISSAHVGSGKPQYDCRWRGCDRHGERSFSSKQKILRHIQSHTGHKPFQCVTCRERFSEAATLQQHIRRHTQEKPYACDFPGCNKAFAITGALTIHKRTHNGHKPFKCSFCEKAFSETSNLSKHLRTHTGARPYPCTEPNCDKKFSRPDQLARHLTSHNRKKSEG